MKKTNKKHKKKNNYTLALDPKQQELRIKDVTRRGFLLWPRLDLGPYEGFFEGLVWI